MTKSPLTDEDGEVRELTAQDVQAFRPIMDVDPGMVDAMNGMKTKAVVRSNPRGRETHIGFDWDPDLVASIKASGRDYNARVERLVRDAHRRGKLRTDWVTELAALELVRHTISSRRNAQPEKPQRPHHANPAALDR